MPMNRLVLSSLFALLAVTTVAAASPPVQDDTATLRAQSDQWDRVIVAKDRAAIAANMADDFRQIDGRGNLFDKEHFVADVVDDKLTIDPYTVEDFDIRLYGSTALLSGRTHMTGKYDGQAFTSDYRYIDVYVKREGAWKIVSVQITRIPPAQ